MRHTALWSCSHIPNIIDLSRKKQLFDLEVKGQGPTKVIMVCDTPPYGHAHIHQISLTYLERQKCYGSDNKILLKNIIWPWGQRSRSHEGHYGTRHTVLWSCTHIPNIIDLSRKTKNVMARTRKYYLKNNYLTFMSKVKVQRRSLRYATHRLMDMHPHTKYHWPISKETIIWPWGQRTRSHEGHYGTWHTALWSYTHIPNIIDLSQDKNAMVQTRKYYLKNNYLTLRSKVKVPGRSLWYTTPPYGHAPIPNIIDLSQKKQLFDSKVKGQGPIKVIMVCDTPPYGHAPTYQITLTYLERNNYLTLRSKVKVQTKVIMVRDTPLMDMHPHTIDLSRKTKNVMARTRKYYLKNNYLTFRSKVIMVCNTPPYGHAPTYQISLTYLERQTSYGPDKLRWEAEAEEKNQTETIYISLRSKGRHN
jgi:hypothetical protein